MASSATCVASLANSCFVVACALVSAAFTNCDALSLSSKPCCTKTSIKFTVVFLSVNNSSRSLEISFFKLSNSSFSSAAITGVINELASNAAIVFLVIISFSSFYNSDVRRIFNGCGISSRGFSFNVICNFFRASRISLSTSPSPLEPFNLASLICPSGLIQMLICTL